MQLYSCWWGGCIPVIPLCICLWLLYNPAVIICLHFNVRYHTCFRCFGRLRKSTVNKLDKDDFFLIENIVFC